MAKLKDILAQRMKGKSSPNKMQSLGGRSSSGDLSGFSGVFRVAELTQVEKEAIEKIVHDHNSNCADVQTDIKQLYAITSEVKAINNQAIVLHGERIKRAQELLGPYKEGAFTAWLVSTYGNRQTPYNFLQYFEFYDAADPELQKKIDMMPKQAIYTLAARDGSRESKEQLVRGYQGENKKLILEKIRDMFPIKEEDKRRKSPVPGMIKSLDSVLTQMQKGDFRPSPKEKKVLEDLLTKIAHYV